MGLAPEALQTFKQEKFQSVTDFDEFALALTDCLNDTRPEIRDGIAYEGLTYLMREKILSPDKIVSLQNRLLEINSQIDNNNVGRPFAALVLSEVARTDRVEPWMSDEARSDFVKAAANYVSTVTDYRGFNDEEGWRHGVAHGADWLMQLALNENVSDNDMSLILDSVASQVKPDGQHSYIHGEPERLARPVLFIARRGLKTQEEWTEWLEAITDPAPLESWSEAFGSESGLAQRHNVKAFTYSLYVNAAHSQNENIRTMLPGLTEQIKKIH